ncbi:MAG TPA: peptidoglycan-binding domain-containing protein [Caulobacter sp.]|nr:peptidoglycan-binding domain-containing protein [Caulobacter sp.]
MVRFGSAVGALVVAASLGVGLAPAAGDDYCPPNPEPGKCYEKVLLPGYDGRESRIEWREIPCRTRMSDVRVITTPAMVSGVQAALATYGYYGGSITGQSNASTEQGLARFQADYGLKPGWNAATLQALGVPWR